MRIGLAFVLLALVVLCPEPLHAEEAPETLKEIAGRLDSPDAEVRRMALEALLGLARTRYGVPWATFGPERTEVPDEARGEIVTRLEQALRDPELPIGGAWLAARVLTARRLDDMRGGWGSVDGHPVLTREELALHLPRIERAMALKRDRVAGVSLTLLLTYGHPVAHAGVAAARCWPHLTRYEKVALLREQWDRVRCDALDDVLRRRLVAPAAHDPHQHADHVPSWVVRRGLAFAPEAARALILEDLARSEPRFTTEALLALPDRYLPALQDRWVQRDTRGRWVGAATRLAPVIERYATAALVPRVQALLHSGSGSWAVDIQSHLIRYLLKHDPQRGLQEVETVLRRRDRGATYRTVLERTLPRYWSRAAEAMALKALQDKELAVSRSAAFALVRAGSREAYLAVLRWVARLASAPITAVPVSEGAVRQQVLSELKAQDARWEHAAEVRSAVQTLLEPGEVDWLLPATR